MALNLHLIKIFNQNTKEGENKISHIYETPTFISNIPHITICSDYNRKKYINFLLCETLIPYTCVKSAKIKTIPAVNKIKRSAFIPHNFMKSIVASLNYFSTNKTTCDRPHTMPFLYYIAKSVYREGKKVEKKTIFRSKWKTVLGI